MHKVIGYGEDALTYKTLTKNLGGILKKIGDNSNQSDCLVIYRPSFGRKGGFRSEFGEFDAILSTPKTIYLIESKWIRQKNNKLVVGKVQLIRHSVFKWYLSEISDTVLGGKDKEWENFRNKHNNRIDGLGKVIPRSGTKLVENIRKVLKELKSDGEDKNIKNILLLFINDSIVRPKIEFESKEEKFEEPIWVPVKHEGWEEMEGR